MIDFHCHLDLYPDPVGLGMECAERGLYVLAVTTTPTAWEGTTRRLSGMGRIRVALGLHPELAHERKGELSLFEELLPRVKYVGEIGLDGSPALKQQWPDQVYVFERILSACQSAGGRIMTIHSRRATAAVLDRLGKYGGAGTPILHWYSGSYRDLSRAIEMGCWFSVGPAMLRTDKGRELVSRMPRSRLLTETDGPFAMLDDRTIMPWDVERAVKSLALMWGLDEAEAERVLQDNLRSLLSSSEARSSP